MSAPGTPGVAGTGETGAGPALVGYDADRERGVAVLTLDSVANRNALSRPLLDQLTALLRRAAADDAVRVVVLRANGPSFCSGADLAAVRSGAMTPIVEGVVEVQRLVVTMPKPVVARVHGTVRAGGLGLVAAADVAVGSLESSYALTEVRLGLAAAAVSLTVLPRLGDRAAADYLLTGLVFGGAEAERAGLLTRAVPEAELDTAVDAYLEDLLLGSPQGLREAKALLTAPMRARMDEFGQEMVDLSARLFASPEARRATEALLSRTRRPR
ncbi:enoyl-CoA hydratase-related protein [Streptosporangium sp. NPDC002544]|uniref:enoyl-CoA hydratase-related protein n=1 Tax=Streptosporangium sp. NPDC002544 TaxID=3154538 RepID=UPI0033222888